MTDDGSASLFVPAMGEHYHSTRGAMGESRHVFIANGLQHYIDINPTPSPAEPLTIFEMGFGTGLNALLTWQFCHAQGFTARYIGVEKHPLEEPIWRALNYPSVVGLPGADAAFAAMHQAKWGVETAIGNIKLLKIDADITGLSIPSPIDVVFYDAFSPSLVPEQWTAELFGRIRAAMRPGGVLVTYAAKGDVRRNLQTAGFAVEKLPGALGKRHMLRANAL